MNKSENLVMENSKKVTKLQTSESNWVNCAEMTRRPLGCAYAINRLVSDATPRRRMNTHEVGTGEAVNRIQNMWRQLGGVGSRSLKWQYEKPTKSAQKILKRGFYAMTTAMFIIWTTQWTIWLGSHPYGERN